MRVILFVATKSKDEQPQQQGDDHPHARSEGDQRVMKIAWTDVAAQREVCRSAQDVSDAREDADNEKWLDGDDGRFEIAVHRVGDIKQNHDDQDAVNRRHYRIREGMPAAQELDNAAHQDDAGDEQEARHDEVLDDENGPSYGAVSAPVLRPISSHVFLHLDEGYRGRGSDALP